MDNAKILIEYIESETNKTLVAIKKIQKLCVHLILERSIDKEDYKRIQFITDGNHKNISDDLENIKKDIESLCDSYRFTGNWKLERVSSSSCFNRLYWKSTSY